MNNKFIKVGDIFEIPLSNNKKAFGQYVFWDSKNGPLIKVFDLIPNLEEQIPIEDIIARKELFPPVITGLMAAIKIGLWKIVGHSEVKDFIFPEFISAFVDYKSGKVGYWYLWNGINSTNLGHELPEKFKNLEFLVVHSPYDIPERIETGVKPYDSLIRFNKI